MKYTGTVNGPTYKYTIGRDDLTVMGMGVDFTAAIGLNSWASFADTQDGHSSLAILPCWKPRQTR